MKKFLMILMLTLLIGCVENNEEIASNTENEVLNTSQESLEIVTIESVLSNAEDELTIKSMINELSHSEKSDLIKAVLDSDVYTKKLMNIGILEVTENELGDLFSFEFEEGYIHLIDSSDERYVIEGLTTKVLEINSHTFDNIEFISIISENTLSVYTLVGNKLKINDITFDEYSDISIIGNSIQLDSNLTLYSGPGDVLYRMEIDNKGYSLIPKFLDDNLEVQLGSYLQESYVLRDYYMDKLYENGWEESKENFPEKIHQLLIENQEQLLTKPWLVYLDNFTLLDAVGGDLNGDDITDYAVVMEREYGFLDNDRKLYLLISSEDGYTLEEDANQIILGSGSGGVFGDPYAGMKLVNERFEVMLYGGSSYKWGYIYAYHMINDELKLITLESLSFNGNSGIGTVLIDDFTTGMSQLYTVNFEEDTDNLLVGEYEHGYDRAYLSKQSDTYYDILWKRPFLKEPLPVLPDELVTYESDNIALVAIDILDWVRTSYFSDAMKKSYTYSEEIINNYSKVLSYEIPTYFYENDDFVIWYGGVDDQLYYRVFARSKESGETTTYVVQKIDDDYIVDIE